MFLRMYNTSDCEFLAELFYQTVHNVNAKDYTKEQLDVWATGNVNLNEWDKSFLEQRVNANKIITHASITAKTFFEQRGYRVIKGQQVIRNGISLTNYVMEKQKI